MSTVAVFACGVEQEDEAAGSAAVASHQQLTTRELSTTAGAGKGQEAKLACTSASVPAYAAAPEATSSVNVAVRVGLHEGTSGSFAVQGLEEQAAAQEGQPAEGRGTERATVTKVGGIMAGCEGQRSGVGSSGSSCSGLSGSSGFPGSSRFRCILSFRAQPKAVCFCRDGHAACQPASASLTHHTVVGPEDIELRIRTHPHHLRLPNAASCILWICLPTAFAVCPGCTAWRS